ncbi:MAG: hypothetical protein IJ088_11695 [Clostridia bacterium]|nr:hypothetical protein [Clostridia bacterium]
MSQIRVKDKKTGHVRVYEIIPDSFTPTGLPRKRFIGTEGPDGTLIPPTPRKKKKTAPPQEESPEVMLDRIQKMTEEITQLQESIALLEKKRADFSQLMQDLLSILKTVEVDPMISGIDPESP